MQNDANYGMKKGGGGIKIRIMIKILRICFDSNDGGSMMMVVGRRNHQRLFGSATSPVAPTVAESSRLCCPVQTESLT